MLIFSDVWMDRITCPQKEPLFQAWDESFAPKRKEKSWDRIFGTAVRMWLALYL